MRKLIFLHFRRRRSNVHFRNAKAAKDDAQAASESAKRGWAEAKRWKKYYLQDRERKQATHGGLAKLKNSRLFFGLASPPYLACLRSLRGEEGSGGDGEKLGQDEGELEGRVSQSLCKSEERRGAPQREETQRGPPAPPAHRTAELLHRHGAHQLLRFAVSSAERDREAATSSPSAESQASASRQAR